MTVTPTPRHSPDHLCLLDEAVGSRSLFTGDALGMLLCDSSPFCTTVHPPFVTGAAYPSLASANGHRFVLPACCPEGFDADAAQRSTDALAALRRG
jgi:glyoxylase-like metal-dependent hydrolase (beta-lactamase superfamily II)